MAESFRGRGVIAGIAMGRVMMVGKNIDGYLKTYEPGTPEEESEKASAAIAAVAENLQESVKRLRETGMREQSAIMDTHRMMVQDPMLEQSIVMKVQELKNAPMAVLAAAKDQAAVFEQMDDDYFRERATDIRDVGKSIAKFILGIKDPELGTESVIICGHEIEPSVIANIPAEKIAGVILGQGSTTCHAVIIAKARSIPTVVGIGDNMSRIDDGGYLVLDGSTGEIIPSPSEGERAVYGEKLRKQRGLEQYYSELAELPAATTDGVSVKLAANIGNHMDIDNARTFGADGVGLFRSEFVFMGREDIPNEKDQFLAYRNAIEKCHGSLCIIRTMDIGGDKPLPYLDIPHEDNPFLGCRAIRISLRRRDLFLPQLKAILRAGVFGPAAILIPMVINVSEIKAVQGYIAEAKAELASEGRAYSDEVQLGIMIETPAAAVMAGALTKYVDFFSIGTNDLVQYTLAVDRSNSNIEELYDHFNPAVLRLVQHTIKAAHDHGKWCGMCGEMAGDPYAAVLLLAMGIDELSMSAPSIPHVKEKIRGISFVRAKEVLGKVMEIEDGGEIREYMRRMLS